MFVESKALLVLNLSDEKENLIPMFISTLRNIEQGVEGLLLHWTGHKLAKVVKKLRWRCIYMM